MKNKKSILIILLCGLVIFGLSIFSWVKAPDSYSEAERRALAKLPALSVETLKSGKFMDGFESYSMDQFPMRDGFRSFKAVADKYAFLKKDNHGLYSVKGYLSKLEYPLNEDRVKRSIKKINEICDTYLEGTACKTYLSLIPDKNYFLAPLGNYPAIDYDGLVKRVEEEVKCESSIDIFDLLALEDYYFTDQHWRQEKVIDVAERIASSMNGGNTLVGKEGFTENVLEYPFFGAYVGQSALSFPADQIIYLTNDSMDHYKVTSYHTGSATEASLYDMDKAYGKDPYELFLTGTNPLLVIENPSAEREKELVVFRDSFGSSLIPLLAADYSKVTIVDLRYMKSGLIGDYVNFTDQDVLFLYSTLILNNSISM